MNDRDIQGPESKNLHLDFQLTPGIYEYKHVGKNSFNLILILTLAASGGAVKGKDLIEEEGIKNIGLNKIEVVSPIEISSNQMNITQNENSDIVLFTEESKPIVEEFDVEVSGIKPGREVDLLISTTPEILFKIVDITNPIEKEYLLQEVEPKLIKLTDLNGFLENGFNFPVLNPETRVHALMKDDLIDLVNKAQNDGVSIYIRSGYRNYWEQQFALNKVNGDTSKVSLPGQSQHQTGLAIDFSTPENEHAIGLYSGFDDTNTGKWLLENSWKFGYIQPYVNRHDGIDPLAEPHHYLYVGQEIARVYYELREIGWKGDIFDLQEIFTIAANSSTSEK